MGLIILLTLCSSKPKKPIKESWTGQVSPGIEAVAVGGRTIMDFGGAGVCLSSLTDTPRQKLPPSLKLREVK